MSTGLRKQQPQKRRIQRPSGDQDNTVGASPSFGKRTKIQGIINCDSISSHTYVKESTQSNGFAYWKMPDNKRAIAIDRIYLREGGSLQTRTDIDVASSINYVKIYQSYMVINSDGLEDAAGWGLQVWGATGTNSNALSGSSTGTGTGVFAQSVGSGYALHANATGGGFAGYFAGNVYCTLDVSALTFTDRTPFYDGDALTDIKNIKSESGEIRHSSLPEFVKSYKIREGVQVIERNLGNMVSVNVRAIQQLIEKVDYLKEKLKNKEI